MDYGEFSGDIREEMQEIARLAEEHDDHLVKLSLSLTAAIKKLDLSELTLSERVLLYHLATAMKNFAMVALQNATIVYLHAGVDPSLATIEVSTNLKIDKETGHASVSVQQDWGPLDDDWGFLEDNES